MIALLPLYPLPPTPTPEKKPQQQNKLSYAKGYATRLRSVYIDGDKLNTDKENSLTIWKSIMSTGVGEKTIKETKSIVSYLKGLIKTQIEEFLT